MGCLDGRLLATISSKHQQQGWSGADRCMSCLHLSAQAPDQKVLSIAGTGLSFLR